MAFSGSYSAKCVASLWTWDAPDRADCERLSGQQVAVIHHALFDCWILCMYDSFVFQRNINSPKTRETTYIAHNLFLTSLVCAMCSVQRQARECNFCHQGHTTHSFSEVFLVSFKNSCFLENYFSVILETVLSDILHLYNPMLIFIHDVQRIA